MRLLALIFAAFITLHTLSGREVYVNADEVMLIQSNAMWNVGGCLSEIMVHDKAICVVEAPTTVKKLVEGAKQ